MSKTTPNTHEKVGFEVRAEIDLTEPALVAAAFDILRREAAFYGLPNIGQIYIRLSVGLDGYTYPKQIERLQARLDQLWLGGLEQIKIKEPDH